MTDKVEDGGPAFPVHRHHSIDSSIVGSQGGMSLRDWFAGQALAGLCSHLAGPTKQRNETGAGAHARAAYEYADAMLRARKQSGAA